MGHGKSYSSFEELMWMQSRGNGKSHRAEIGKKAVATGGHPAFIYADAYSVKTIDHGVCDASSMYPSFIEPRLYNLKWTLKDDWGHKWSEVNKNITLDEFEVIYGNNFYTITKVKLSLVKT